MSAREPAWRVLAQEFLAALEEEKGVGEKAASYLLSPLGARMNRVLLVGTLAAAESIGKEESQPFLRARLTDPTGTVTVTGGGFQPRALSALKRWTSPHLALVVGKAHLFRGRDGAGYGSVRAEAIRAISEEEFRAALLDAVEQTYERMALLERLRRDPADAPPTTEAPRAWVESVRAALGRYPSLDREVFRRGLESALSVASAVPLTGAPAPPATPPVRPAPGGSARVTRTPPTVPRPAPTAQERAIEASFLDILDDLSENSADGYADLKEALERAAAHGLSESRAEELLNRLEETGVLEEPVVGKLRRA
jgi:uncharacterized protein